MIHGLIAFCQMAVGVLAHGVNPDGTPATTIYEPKK